MNNYLINGNKSVIREFKNFTAPSLGKYYGDLNFFNLSKN